MTGIETGVNLASGDDLSAYAARCIADTWKNNPFVTVHDHSRGHFRGPRTYTTTLPEGTQSLPASDGIGTKVVLAAQAMTYHQAAIDLAAMVCGDITRYGGIPLVMANVLDLNKVGDIGSKTHAVVKSLYEGYRDVLNAQGVVALAGETAELGDCVSSEIEDATMLKFNWSGFLTGGFHPDVGIFGDAIKPGHIVVALREKGPRCNGFTDIRSGLRYEFGARWWESNEARSYILAAATPATLYDQLFVHANGWYDNFKDRIPLSGIAHITGGGIPSKFGDLLRPTGHSAVLDDLWDPPEIHTQSAHWIEKGTGKRFTVRKFYSKWHGGQGALVVLDECHVDTFIALCFDFGIEAKRCGVIRKSRGTQRIRIKPRWRNKGWETFAV